MGRVKGTVYLLCFAHSPYKHAKHYLGATGMPLAHRLGAHRGENHTGRPAKLLSALLGAGGDFVVADVWETDTREEAFELEKRLKRFRAPGRICSICHPGNRLGRMIRTKAMVRELAEAEAVRRLEEQYPPLHLPDE